MVEESGHILQADIAPFMASLLGIQFPVNNVVSRYRNMEKILAAQIS